MCGIAGFLESPATRTSEALRRIAGDMTATLRHRGPDGGGLWIDAAAGVGLGHRRLAIIDLSPAGAQPMTSLCGRYVIVFNGEIYNFQALREQLRRRGCEFRGNSDTEVIPAAVAEWGIELALQRFNGMFAFALWDKQDRILHLARDRSGEKPLYYGRAGSVFLFGSELKALRAHPDFAARVNREALAFYSRHSYVAAPHSIYEDVFKLPPGCHASVRWPGAWPLAPEQYWSARETVERAAAAPFAGDPADAVLQLDSLLRDAVGQRMISDVPLGAFLSGGIDSSAIVALMQTQASRPVKTFTIGFRETDYNEADKASLVARHLGTDHTELYVGPQQAFDLIPRLPALYDEPFADSSQIPTFLLAELTRRHVTVSLSGDGGDELFAGYKLYRVGSLLWRGFGWMPGPVRRASSIAVNLLAAGLRMGAGRDRRRPLSDKLRKAAPVLRSGEAVAMYRQLVSNWRSSSPLVSGAAPAQTAVTNSAEWADLRHVVDRMMYCDLVTYLPDDILVKVDRATMGASLESRAPFLDHRVIEFAWRLPLDLKYRWRGQKWALRQLLYRYVPRDLVDRPKTGFAIPLASWLRGPLREFAETLLAKPRLEQGGWFDTGTVRRLWTEHVRGRANWEQPLWSVLMFEAWLDRQHSPSDLREPDVPLAIEAYR